MSTFRLQIKCDNEAFDGDSQTEIARILRLAAMHVNEGQDSGSLFDINGNRVGSYTLTGGKG
jgi:hypothetical protein